MNNERWKPSVTVAAVIEDGGRFLLVEEVTPEGVMLNNPAGHLDPGESPIQAVVRETLEETGRHFVPDAFLGIYLSRVQRPSRSEDVTYLRLAFTGTVGEPIEGWVLDKGIVRTLWMTPDEIRNSTHRQRSPLVLQCIEDHLSGRRLPLDVIHADTSLYMPEIKG